jgi:two-component system sensor histidine kinase AlgZ
LWLAPMEMAPLGEKFALRDGFIMRNLAISAIVSAVALRYFYVQHQSKQNMLIEARSRIQALQARIRPHFLFNSMNTIASLTRTNPQLAEKAVEDLADLFRASLGHQDMVKLDEELEFTRRYINIEELRLGDRLSVEWQIDDAVDPDARVPALILQPLMENAIYHGVEPLPQGGVVNLSIDQSKKRLQFTISNPLPAQRAYQQRSGNKMAQDNIRQRLKLAYGDTGTMNIEKTDDRYTVSFSIPLEVRP